MRYCTLLPLVLSLAASAAVAAPAKVAVFDFKTMGAPQKELDLFMEQVLTEIDATGKYKSIGKSDLATMLGMEKLKEDLGANCEESCMAEIAGSVGAQFVLSGNLIKSSDGYAVLVKLIDQSKAEVLSRVDREVRGDFSALRRGVSGIVREVLGLSVAISGAKGELALKITPEKAEYSIDGGRVAGTLNPGMLDVVELPAGAHKVRLSAPGHADLEEDVLVEAGRVATLERTLLRPAGKRTSTGGTGYLDIVTAPAETEGADIFLDGALRPEKAPATLKNVPAGDHVLSIRKPLYREWRDRVTVRKDQFKKVTATLEPNFGPLKIASSPPGADVYIDGIKVGATPYTEDRREAKAYKLELTANLYHDLEQTVFVEARKGLDATFNLTPAFGTLEIDAGGVTGADVLLDGTPRCKTPCTLQRLASRTYYVKVTKALHAPWEQRVAIRDGEVARPDVVLDSRFGTVKVTSEPSGASVLLDGKPVGETPFERKLSTGSYRLEVSAGKRYHTHAESLVLGRNDVKTIAATLKPRLGKVMVSANVRGASIAIDGKPRGESPKLVEGLFIGEHEVKLSAPRHLDATQKVTVREGEVVELELSLTRLLAREIAAQEIAKWEDERFPYQAGGWALSVAAAGLAVGAGVAGYLGTQDEGDADDLHGRYSAANSTAEADRLWAELSDARDAAELKYGLAWGLGGAAVAALVGGVVCFVMSPEKPELHIEGETASVVPAVFPGGAGVMVRLPAGR